MNFPIIRFDERKAADAYLAYIALLECEIREIRDPSLRDSPAWSLIKLDAFERFAAAYERA